MIYLVGGQLYQTEDETYDEGYEIKVWMKSISYGTDICIFIMNAISYLFSIDITVKITTIFWHGFFVVC